MDLRRVSNPEEAPSVPGDVRTGRGLLFGLLGVVILAAAWAAGNLEMGEQFHEGTEGSFSMVVALGGGALIGLLVAVGARGRTRAVSGVVAIQAVLAVAMAELTWPVFEAWREGRDVEVLAMALQHLGDVLTEGWIAFNVATGLVFAALSGSAVLGWLGARAHERGHEGSATVQRAATGRIAGAATGAPGPAHPSRVDGGADSGVDNSGSRPRRKVLVQVLVPGLILVGVVALVEYRPWTDMVFLDELRAGDCFDDPETDEDWITEVRGVPCEQPHDNEVFALAELTNMPETYPTQRMLARASDDLCAEHFEQYVGTPLSGTDLGVMGMYPDQRAGRTGTARSSVFSSTLTSTSWKEP
jgi:hypothetical protein